MTCNVVPPANCDGPQDVKAASELGIRRVLHLGGLTLKETRAGSDSGIGQSRGAPRVCFPCNNAPDSLAEPPFRWLFRD